MESPSWALFVKTGVNRQRMPSRSDWWYIRCASILRKLYLRDVIGVSRLRTLYGGRRRRGHMPPKFRKGSGVIARKALQQLEKANLLVMISKKGRALSPKGRNLLDETARIIIDERQRKQRT